jgi:uncharacterized protein YvpB
MKNIHHKLLLRVGLAAGLAGLTLLILGAFQVALGQQDQPASATPSATLTETLWPVDTLTATMLVSATLEAQATATFSPEVQSTATNSPAATATATPGEDGELVLPGASDSVSPTLAITSTLFVTPTIPTPTVPSIRLPLIMNQPTQTPAPSGTLLSCRSSIFVIPDNKPGGIVESIWINDTRAIQDLNIRLSVNHNWIGDLEASLTHFETGTTIRLLSRPGSPNCNWDNPRIILDDEMVLSASGQCPSWAASSDPLAPYMRGGFKPDQPLSYFDGQSIRGEWRLQIADLSPNDVGSLTGWCLSAEIGSALPYSPPPPAKDLPRAATVSGVTTFPQNMPLDCESRVAVDWARYYGRSISEYTFFYNLPHSDNPDVGFVGNVWGDWGQIPPNDYGIHAEPVAALLRTYGVSAYAHKGLSFEDLKAEIATGHPVYVWIVGSVVDVYRDGLSYPAYYMGNNGQHSLVTPYEHVVIVVGYNEDTDMVTIKNEGQTYFRSFEKFLRSWSHMGNMAVLSHP